MLEWRYYAVLRTLQFSFSWGNAHATMNWALYRRSYWYIWLLAEGKWHTGTAVCWGVQQLLLCLGNTFVTGNHEWLMLCPPSKLILWGCLVIWMASINFLLKSPVIRGYELSEWENNVMFHCLSNTIIVQLQKEKKVDKPTWLHLPYTIKTDNNHVVINKYVYPLLISNKCKY